MYICHALGHEYFCGTNSRHSSGQKKIPDMATHILVVDDSPAGRLFVGHILGREADLKVTFACDGHEALRSLDESPPALIVSDIRMPEMNGLELVRQLKESGANIPVILMTSYGSEQIAVQALEAGAASYVSKRNLETNLVKTIRNVFAVTIRRQNRRRTLGGMTFFEAHFVLGNDASSVSDLISHLLDTAVMMKRLIGQEVTHIGVALQEALSNAINHGNLDLDSELRQVDESLFYALADERRGQPPYMNRRVSLEAEFTQRELTFVITDEGSGFDTLKIADPTAEINLDRVGGRGLLLIRSFMDSVRHNARGNQITMVKSVTATVPASAGSRANVIIGADTRMTVCH